MPSTCLRTGGSSTASSRQRPAPPRSRAVVGRGDQRQALTGRLRRPATAAPGGAGPSGALRRPQDDHGHRLRLRGLRRRQATHTSAPAWSSGGWAASTIWLGGSCLASPPSIAALSTPVDTLDGWLPELRTLRSTWCGPALPALSRADGAHDHWSHTERCRRRGLDTSVRHACYSRGG
jgi:hypothetical protein